MRRDSDIRDLESRDLQIVKQRILARLGAKVQTYIELSLALRSDHRFDGLPPTELKVSPDNRLVPVDSPAGSGQYQLAAIDQQRQLYAAAHAALIDASFGDRVMPQLVEWHDAFARNFVVDGSNAKVRERVTFGPDGVIPDPPNPKANLRLTYAVQGSATLVRALRQAAVRCTDTVMSNSYSAKAGEIEKLSLDIGEQFYREYADAAQPGKYFLYPSGQHHTPLLRNLSHNNSQSYLIEGMFALAELNRERWEPRLRELLQFIKTQRDPATGLLHEFDFRQHSDGFPSAEVRQMEGQINWQAQNNHETVILGHTLAGFYAGPARLLANTSHRDRREEMTALVQDFVETMNRIGGIHENGLPANAYELVPKGQPPFVEKEWSEGAWQVELLWQFLFHIERTGVDLSKFEVKAGRGMLPLDRLLARGFVLHDEKLFNGTSYVLENGKAAVGREFAAPINHAADTLRDLWANMAGPFWHSHTDNEIKAFVYTIFGLYDRHAPVNEITVHLVDKDLEMCFPNADVRSHRDLEKWYRAVGEFVRWNSHRIEQLHMKVVDHRRYQVDLVLLWIGSYQESKGGRSFTYRVHQTWTVLQCDDAPLKIRRYVVTRFEELPAPPLIS